MDIDAYFQSLTQEFEALKNRVRNFIGDAHWLSDGEWKESILRSILASRLPDTVRIGRGFILKENQVSTQCDIILYKSSSPVLFKDGDFVILPSDAVLGVIEVKTRIESHNLEKSISKLAQIGQLIGTRKFLGLFSYEESYVSSECILEILQRECKDWTMRIDILCLGCSTFVKWWDTPPTELGGKIPDSGYECWHSYHLENIAAGYFLTNLIDIVCPGKLLWNNNLWFPNRGKEFYMTGKIKFIQS